ncbi:glycosyltransferase [Candidatus Ozemobacteraceae bacterium]|nr:glycosyltransferase [Candidatus Ozemobacteraceae bacterium]
MQEHEALTPLYSIVIPAYDEEKLLPACLAAVNEAMTAVSWPGEVVVVDNNSRDRTGEIARERGARVVFEPFNQISRARNTGARAARGKYLMFVDADTFMNGPLLAAAVEAMHVRGWCGGGATVTFDRPLNLPNRKLLELWRAISRSFGLAAGCCIFCRADAFADVGGFSEKVYASEEIWFSWRIKRWGKQRGMPFRIIPSPMIETSGRKTESHLRMILVLLTFLCFPFAARFRATSWFWYRRAE